jgi:hypothetical protein
LRTLFGTATLSDLHELHGILDELKNKNSDIVHSLSNQVTFFKRLGTITGVNTEAIAHITAIINLCRAAFKFRFRAECTEFSSRRPFKSSRVFDNKCL